MIYGESTAMEFSTELVRWKDWPIQIIRFANRMEILTSAFVNGGRVSSSCIMIMEVPKNFTHLDPEGCAYGAIGDLGLPKDTVVFMTAAEIEYVFNVIRGEYGDTFAYGIVTAGLSNQVVAGELLVDWESRHMVSEKRSAAMKARFHSGTINCIAISPVSLTDAGMVNALIPVTEAKTAAMNIMGYRETGTTSDAVAVVCPAKGIKVNYAGTGTDVGIAMARAVKTGVVRALVTRDDFPQEIGEDDRRRIAAEYSL